MKIPLSRLRDEPRDMQDGEIDVVSTSRVTADASPIILKSTDIVQIKFTPTLVQNENDTQKCLNGKLIYERKKKRDANFPTEKLSRSSIRVGEFMEISLSTSETYALFQGLKSLYDLYDKLGSTPLGSYTYAKVDNNFELVKDMILNEPAVAHMLIQKENVDVIKTLLQYITHSGSVDVLRSTLKELEQSNIDELNNSINSEKLERVLQCLKDNLTNSNEEDWQKIFRDNQWLLSQVFSMSYTIFEEKAYVGGKNISNKGGNICDFLYQNELTNNVALIEIKTPCTPLFGTQYRHTYSFSNELSGGINQVLNYKDSLCKQYYTLQSQYEQPFEAINPKCFLIIGCLSELNPMQVKTLENYRNSFSAVQILTFDEIIQRTENFIAIFNASASEEVIIGDDEELPF